jgi:hypothetical protein
MAIMRLPNIIWRAFANGGPERGLDVFRGTQLLIEILR